MSEREHEGCSGADISECGQYRYRLWRWWDSAQSMCLWIMLNPSTADADTDDPTIRKCCGYARRWGYGGIMVVNLFAYRATDPRELRRVADPVGPDNDVFIRTEAEAAGAAVCAWGTKGGDRASDVVNMLEGVGVELWAVRFTHAGHPGHPLYVSYDAPRLRLANGARVQRGTR